VAVGREQWRRRVSFATLLAGVALSLVLGTCGHDETTAVASPTAPVADRLTVGAAPPIAPTVDLAAKNLTATAYRPTVNIVTHGPTTLGTPSHGGPIVDHVSFVDKLRSKRCTVDPVGSARQPFLRGQGTVLRVSGCTLGRPAELQSFWYHTDDLGMDGLRAAEEDARGIPPDGQPAVALTWEAPPHFFRKERALVFYLGNDPALLALLTELLGPQFAGR